MTGPTLRLLGRDVPALGLGCWAIGGPAFRGDEPMGWGAADDRESTRAIRRALDLGIAVFDTADMYGCGHSERVLGAALAGRRSEAVVITKFGYRFDEGRRQVTGRLRLPDEVFAACDASLARLRTDVIDVYLLHLRDLPAGDAAATRDALEELIARGKIRGYGWSTDDHERAARFAEGSGCVAVEQAFNVLQGDEPTLALCEARGLASLQRSPLAMGLLTGRFSSGHRAAPDDVRARFDFDGPTLGAALAAVDALRGPLTAGGRSMVQGALGLGAGDGADGRDLPAERLLVDAVAPVAVVVGGAAARRYLSGPRRSVRCDVLENPGFD